MTNHCIVCDCLFSNPLFPGIIKCRDCGYVYADLNMSQKEFEELYNSGYFSGEEYSDYLSDKNVVQRNFSNRLKTLMQYVNPEQHQSLLEVGSAYGFFCGIQLNTCVNQIDI